MSRNRIVASAVIAVAFALLTTACSTPKVLPARPHEPSSAHQVKIYQRQPKKYEQLGTILLPIELRTAWDEHGNANATFDEMKRQAAALGANGLMLQPLPGQSTGRIAAGYRGEFYGIPMKTQKPRAAIAQAIYVVKE